MSLNFISLPAPGWVVPSATGCAIPEEGSRGHAHKQRRKARAEYASAAASASRRPHDPSATAAVEDARRDYRYIAASEYVRDLVDAAPPLTADQRDQLALLLRGAGGPDA